MKKLYVFTSLKVLFIYQAIAQTLIKTTHSPNNGASIITFNGRNNKFSL
jgi:hypothetical protein